MSDLNVYTTAEINALTPVTGDLVLDSTLNAVKLYDGAAWKTFDSEVEAFQNRWSASFDGTNEYLDCGTISALNSATAYTVSAWFKLTANTTSNNSSFIFSSGTGFNDGVHIYLDGNSLSYVIGTGSTYSLKRSTVNYRNDAWHHIAGVFNGSTIELYMDGSSVGSMMGGNAPSSTVSVAGTDIQIGARYDAPTPNYSAQGLIDEVAVFNSALTSSEAASLRDTSGSNPIPADISSLNPLGYWRMGDSDTASDGTTISTITDSSGNGNDATQGTASAQPIFSDLTGETVYV
jgi:hypothetical protein